MKKCFYLFAFILASLSPFTTPAQAASKTDNIEAAIQGEEFAKLVEAPFVPPPITRKFATKVIVNLEVKEEVSPIADGVNYNFWTYGGKVPGNFIRVREGDLVEFHLNNHPKNKNPHNIDLHAVNGPGGGGTSSFTAPGHSSVFSFKALNPGLYVYHCATAPVAMHIANGMYGLILVEPAEGLPKVDREYYVMQGDFYTQGSTGEKGLQAFSMEKAVAEKPDYVLFNGAMGALQNEKALTSKVGETVRIFIGNGGPNLVSSFHIIGQIFDRVWQEGSMSAPGTNIQTTLVAPGGAAIVEFMTPASGTYILVDHALTRAFNKGALGHLMVASVDSKASQDKLVYSGKQSDEIYQPEGANVATMASDKPKTAKSLVKDKPLADKIKAGEIIYRNNCSACHQPKGQGIPQSFPPLAKADYFNENMERAIRVVIAGLSGKITVNGQVYDSMMPAWDLKDHEVADVLTYISQSWGNKPQNFKTSDVKAVRKKLMVEMDKGGH
ncbi:MAG: copper-containing nitrite reductase [Candidatus Pacebacteria bacterium]|nr:copper-containing nitrite reductase [Candidatus Paceibacterota bacterium]